MTININGVSLGPDFPPYIVAELSANHNGSLDKALNAISVAHRCGANAIKIQSYNASSMTIDCESSDFIVNGGLWDGYKLYDLYKEAETPYEWHKKIFDYAANLGITIFSTPFDESAVDLLESLDVPAYKIASFEAIDLPLIRYVAGKGKPMIISTGMCTEEEIEEAVETAKEAGCKELVLLHCISSYPAPIDQANLLQMPALAKRFGTISGLSDHSLGTTVSVAAVSLGASLIEKHFTLSRKEKGPDSDFSIEPDELQQLCGDSHDAWVALGQAGFERQEVEEGNKLFRRSIYFVKDIKIGEVITREHIRRIRPGFGLPPKCYDQLLGKKVNQNILQGTAASWGLIEGSICDDFIV